MFFNTKIKILISDEHTIFRNGLKILLNQIPSIEVIGETKNGQELIDMAIIKEPDVIIADVFLPIKNGIDAAREVIHNNRNIKFIVLTVCSEDQTIIDMLEAGVLGFVNKDIEIEELYDCVRSVYMGKPYFSKSVAEKLTSIIARQQYLKRKPSVHISAREIEVINLLCKEYTTKEISDKLKISKRTIEGHRTRIMHKIGAKSLIGIVTFAYDSGIVNDMLDKKRKL